MNFIKTRFFVNWLKFVFIILIFCVPRSFYAQCSAEFVFEVSNSNYVQDFFVGNEETAPNGITFTRDGTKMFISGVSGDDINQYNLATSFDISTANYIQNFSVSTQDNIPSCVSFNNDGTKMFVAGKGNNKIYEYNVNPGYDISTANYSQNFSITSQETKVTGLTFSNDGSKMFICGAENGEINEYDLTTAFDISTAGYVQNFSVSSQDVLPTGLSFSNNGTKMFISGGSGDKIYQYNLITGFDISTASFMQDFSVSTQDNSPSALTFNNEGTKMFITGKIGRKVYEYSIPNLSELCINTPLTNVTHTTTDATGISNDGVNAANGLPSGTNATWAANTITISGTPTVSGTFNYSILLTGGCGSVNATGTIVVNPDNTSSAASISPTLCINTPLTNITHSTTSAVGISNDGVAGLNNLPVGVSATFSSNTITISGTPTVSGIFNYSIPLTGGCGSVNATGTIVVNALPNISAGPDQTICPGTTTLVNGSGAGLGGNYVWDNSITDGVLINPVPPAGSNLYSVTGTDANNCSNTDQVIVTSQDIILPTVITKNENVYLNSLGVGSITAAEVDNSSFDNCGINTETIDISNFTCINVGANTITLTIDDINGNTNTATTIVTVIDTISPVVVTQAKTIYLDATGNASITALDIENGSTDACGINSESLDRTNFNCADAFTNQTVILTVTDVNGNNKSKNASVTVVDTIKPTVLTKNIDLYLDASGNASITPVFINNGSTDICGLDPSQFTLDKTTFNCHDIGPQIIELTIYDVNGNFNKANATVTVKATDSDGDSFSDVCDLDDDNDGITDNEEFLDCSFPMDLSVIGNALTTTSTFFDQETKKIITVNMVKSSPTINGYSNGDIEISNNQNIFFTFSSPVTIILKHKLSSTNKFDLDDNIQLDLQVNSRSFEIYDPNNDLLIVQDFGGILDFNGLGIFQASEFWEIKMTTDYLKISGFDNVSDNFTPVNLSLNCGGYLDTDNDGVANHLDLDSDNDGIYDIIEAGDSAADKNNDGVVNNSDLGFTDLDNDGMNDASFATFPFDTDIDGKFDYVDLDSDADGCSDVIEAGFTDSNSDSLLGPTLLTVDLNGKVTSGVDGYTQPDDLNSNSLYDYMEPGVIVKTKDITIQLDASGSASIVENDIDDGSVDPCGRPFTRSLSRYDFSCADVPNNPINVTLSITVNGITTIGIGKVTVSGPDMDGDNVPNPCDFDDDNDGIYDNDECIISNLNYTGILSIAGNIATGTINGTNYTYTSSQIISTTPSIYSHGTFPVSYNIPNQTAIRNTTASTNTITFNQPVFNPILVFSSIGSGSNPVGITFSDPIEVLWSSAVVENSNTQITGTEGYAIVRLNGSFNSFSFNYLTAENYVNFLFGADNITYCDTDNDGIVDKNDLDSDNDGIHDVMEGGDEIFDTNNDGVVDVNDAGFIDSDNNGMDDNTQLTLEPDTDNDGKKDFQDLDSDGDRCSDVSEAGFTDNNLDSLLGPIPVAVDLNGKVTGVVDGYTIPLDSNGSGIYDFTEAGVFMKTKNISVNLNFLTGTLSILPSQVDDGSYSACGLSNYRVTPNTFDCSDVGNTITVLLEVDDINNVTHSKNAQVTVVNNPPIAIAKLSHTVTLDASGNATVTANQINNGSNDDCTNSLNLTLSKYNFNCSNIGNNVDTLFVVDNNLDSSFAIFNVTVNDILPIITVDDVVNIYSCNNTVTFNESDIISNDTDPYNSLFPALQVDFINTPSSGTIVDNFNGSYSYTPTGNNNHTATATYTVKRDDGTTYNPSNGHFYEFVFDADISWTDAKAAAEARSYLGRSGYLVTITNQLEQDFAFNNINLAGWIGLSQPNNLSEPAGNWQWVDGTSLSYSNWGFGEPNDIFPTNAGIINEDFAHFKTDGTWNDFPNFDPDDPSGLGIQGYFVEYGGSVGDCNNTGVYTGNINFVLNDTVKPTVFVRPSININLDASGNANILPTNIDLGSFDDCSIASLSLNDSSFNCSDVGTRKIALIVTDVNGNTSSDTSTVTVIDAISPIVITQDTILYLNTLGTASVTASHINNGSNDACGPLTLSVFPNSFGCNNLGNNNVTLTVDDNNSVPSTGVAIIDIRDTTSPIVVTQPITVNLNSLANINITAAQIDGGSSDNDYCNPLTLSVFPSTLSCTQLGTNKVVLTVTDFSGNFSTDTAIVTVIGFDNDGDNISDFCDIDDDNDGIKDTDEGNGDTDGDGIIDKFDLDSDNDGIFDVTEGGDGTFDINNDGKVDLNDAGYLDINLNGMSDNTESTTEPDSDSDNIADYLELDSDGDGCNDVVEAVYTDDNGDGILGAASPTFNANGTVSSGTDGYTTPADINGNSIADYTEIGPNQDSTENITSCVSYNWNGSNYISSGSYNFNTTNTVGCDSVVTLNLTIIQPTTGSLSVIDCDSLLWYGTWYNANGAYTHTLVASNGCDSVVTLNLDINDYTNPTIICPINQTDNYNATCSFSLLDYTTLATLNDNCNYPLTVTQFPTPSSIVNTDTVVTLTVTDASNNLSTCSFNLTLSDNIAPIVSCSADTIDYYNNSCSFNIIDYTNRVNLTDNCDNISIVTQSPIVGTEIFNDTVITLTATDSSGNSTSCSFSLNLLDTIKPVIVCPSDTSGILSANCLHTVLDYTNRVIINENCNSIQNIIQTPSPNLFIITDTVISLTVIDTSNNSSTCTFNLELLDTIKPSINCPSAKIEYYDSSCGFSLPDYTLNASTLDNCDYNAVLTQNPSFGTVIYSDTVIKITSTDQSGNFNTCFFSLTILDTIRPIVNCLSTQNIFLDQSCNYILPNFMDSIISSDNCDTSLLISQIPIPGSVLSADTLIVISVTDDAGNNSICKFRVGIFDTITPKINCPGSKVLDSDTLQCGAIYSYTTPIGTDNCVSTTSLISGLPGGSLFPTGLTNNIYNVTDSAGNSATCNFYVLVNDIEFPEIICPNDTVGSYDQNCEFSVPDYSDLVFTNDNCGIETITQLPSENTVLTDSFSTTFTAIDSSGNSSTCSFSVKIIDVDVPQLICPSDDTRMLDDNCKLSIPNFSNQLLVGELCKSSKTVYQKPSPDSIIDFIGTQIISFNVVDTLGNVETCSFNLNVENNEITNCYKLFIPTSFSPDGDGVNDVFKVYGLDTDKLEIEIYNRWGQMLYKSTINNMNWDGTYANEVLPNGTYVYRIFDETGNLKKDGTISIVR